MKGKKVGKNDANINTTQRCVIKEEIKVFGVKPLRHPSKRSIIHWRMKLRYMNSRRPSKPNLPNVPKPSKLLAPTRLRRTFVFSSLSDPAIRPIASTKPHRLHLAILQSFLSSKILSTL